MTDTDAMDGQETPPVPLAEAPAAAPLIGRHGWTPELRPRKRGILIADGLLLEWRNEFAEDAADIPRVRMAAVGGAEVLEIDTPVESGWIRLAVDLARPAGSTATMRRDMLAQLTLQIVASTDEGPVDLEPMIALRTGTVASPRLEGRFSTKMRLPLAPGHWHAITCAFQVTSTAEDTVYDLVVNLPQGATIRISQIEIDWLQTSAVAATSDAIETILPFTATPVGIDIGAPLGSLAEPIVPALEDVEALLAQPAADIGTLSAALLAQSGTPAAALLAEVVFETLGQKIALPAAARTQVSTRLLAAEMLRRSLVRRAMGGNSPEDRIALEVLAGIASQAPLALTASRRIAVNFVRQPLEDDLTHWAAHAERGAILLPAKTDAAPEALVADTTLSIAPDARISPIGLAMLSVLAAAQAGVEVAAEISEVPSGSWGAQSVANEPDERSLTIIGRLAAVGQSHAAPERWLLCRTAPKPFAMFRDGKAIPLETAYALILCIDPGIDTSALLNIEHCRVFTSPQDLHDALANAPARVLSKPVLVLSRATPLVPDYVPQAVVAHWRFAGRYVLSRCTVAYGSAQGKISLGRVRRVELLPYAALAGVLSIPASEFAANSALPAVFIPSNRIALAVPQLPMDAAEMAQVERLVGPDRRSRAEDEALARAGEIDAGLLGTMPLGPNWPIAEMISKRVGQFRKLRHLLSESRNEVTQANASGVLALLQTDGGDLLQLREQIGEFLVSLSLRPDIIEHLTTEDVSTLIDRARQVHKSDIIAQNLSLVAVDLMRRDIGLLFPLFEFLACNLSSEALSTTFGFATHDLKSAADRYVMRLAECMRRYGAVTAQALLITAVHKATPHRLRNNDLLQTFAPILQSSILPAVSAQVGSGIIRRIRDSMPTVDKFQALVQAGDREGALRLFIDSQALAGVDFLRWMDKLRALSNELRGMALPVADIGIANSSSLPRRRLASIIFSDMESLAQLDFNQELDFPSDLNAIARNILGDNRMLNTLLAEQFADTGYAPMALEGETTDEVFHSAQQSAGDLAAIKDGPLISVIMSAFNPDLGLMETALGSITAQTWKNVEVIVIDDASEPDVAEGIRRLVEALPRGRLIRLDQNAGPYIGRNLALKLAEGDFIAIHDADDWSHPQRFAAEMELMLDTPEAQVVTTQHLRVDRAGHIQLEGQFALFGDGPMTSLFRRSVFETIGAFAEVRSRGDIEMRERIAAYFGHQALAVLELPMMLCFADSATLSQRTAANSSEFLQLWRTNISRRVPMTSLFRDGVRLEKWHQLSVPLALRAPSDESFQ